MTATTKEAVDSMFGLVRDTAAVIAPSIDIWWQGVARDGVPVADEEWLRVHMRHAAGSQGSLSCEHGQRRWRRSGLLFVQCFAPLEAGGLTRAMALAGAFRDAIQSAQLTSGVWFRDATATEIGPDKSWFNANTSARFTYDEVK